MDTNKVVMKWILRFSFDNMSTENANMASRYAKEVTYCGTSKKVITPFIVAVYLSLSVLRYL